MQLFLFLGRGGDESYQLCGDITMALSVCKNDIGTNIKHAGRFIQPFQNKGKNSVSNCAPAPKQVICVARNDVGSDDFRPALYRSSEIFVPLLDVAPHGDLDEGIDLETDYGRPFKQRGNG